MANYQCFTCQRVFVLPEGVGKCPSCGGSNGQVISNEQVIEGMEKGAFWNIDPQTGNRTKNTR
jgi:rRNA maturation endonuclease Nob1